MAAEIPPFEESLAQIIDALLLAVWTGLPGRVLAYDAASLTATVQPLPADHDGQGGFAPLPVLSGVRVLFPAGAGGAITWPLKAGDGVWLSFASRPIERLLATGAEGDPQNARHHSLADVVAHPVLLLQQLADVPAGDLELREPTGGQVLIGHGATAPAARQGDAVSAGTLWSTWFSSIGSALSLPPPAVALGSITGGSAVVKVK